MRVNDKRTSKGSLLPNIYFLLQVVIVLLIASIVYKLNFGGPTNYIVVVVSITSVLYFLIRRREIIHRQK